MKGRRREVRVEVDSDLWIVARERNINLREALIEALKCLECSDFLQVFSETEVHKC